MRELRNRVATLVARVRAGEGAQVLAEVGEAMERWIKTTSLPLPTRVRVPLEQLGEVLGDFARAHRPGPADVHPPPEPMADASRPPLDHAAAPAPEPRAPAAMVMETTPAPAREPALSRVRAGKPASNGAAAAKPNGGAAKKPAGKDGQRPKRSKSKPAPASAAKKPRVSARRSTTAKKVRAESSAPKPSEPPTRKKTSNGKGRARRPAARRTRDDKTDKPT